MKDEGRLISEILTAYFQVKKKNQSAVSVRMLARKLGLSPSYTHQTLRGERIAAPAVYDQLCILLDVDREKRDFVVHQAMKAKGLLRRVPLSLQGGELKTFGKTKWKPASQRQFDALRDWFYIPILEYTKLPSFQGTAREIASALGLEEQVVEAALKELALAGLLSLNGTKYLKRDSDLEFTAYSEKEKLRNFHRRNLERILENLEKEISNSDVERRLIFGVTFPCRKEDLPMMKQRLTEMAQEFNREFSTKAGADELYQLSVQLIPLVKPKTGG